MNALKTNQNALPAEAFQGLGRGQIAYLRAVEGEEISNLFPNVPQTAPGLKLWALIGADGSPILLTDNRDVAIGNALRNDLTTLSVH